MMQWRLACVVVMSMLFSACDQNSTKNNKPIPPTEECIPVCSGKVCGDDGCGKNCGVCGAAQTCTSGQCTAVACVPNCAGKNCGDDGCGSTCGICIGDVDCIGGNCEIPVVTCTPNCTDKFCGDDGCGDQVTFLSVNSPAFLHTNKNGKIKIGSHVSINYGVYISSHKEVRIGSRVRIGPYAFFSDHETLEEPQEIVVGDDVWVGAKATILPGVHVGRGAVIGTHATVTEDVPDFCVVVGNPARIIRRLDPTRFIPEVEV